MDIDEFSRLLRARQKRIEALLNRQLPVKFGNVAKRYFQDNFLQGGFVDNGLHPWPPAKRLSQGGKSAASRQKTLMSSRKHLYSGISYTVGPARVTVANDVPYASVHQYGAKIPITPKMRRYAWARYYETVGRKKGDIPAGKSRKSTLPRESAEAGLWKGLALTRKNSVKIPARPFIGPSRELDDKLSRLVESELSNILNL